MKDGEIKNVKKNKAVLSFEDYLQFQQVWDQVKDVNYKISMNKAQINNNAGQIKNLQLRNMIIQKDNNELFVLSQKLKENSKKLSIHFSGKYGIDMTKKGALDLLTLEWKTEEALNDEANNFTEEEMIETLEEIEEKKD